MSSRHYIRYHSARFLTELSAILPARFVLRMRRRMEKSQFALKYAETPDNILWHPEEIDQDTKQIAIKFSAPNWQKASGWGDYHFARALQKSLVKVGFSVRLDPFENWYSSEANSDDIVLTLRGREKYNPSPNHLNLMWNICHPDEIALDEFDSYNHVFVASEVYLSEIQQKVQTSISALLQCSDPDVFYSVSTVEKNTHHKLLFVGNSRGELRKIVNDCLEQDLPISLYGRDWQGIIPPEKILAPFIPNNRLHNYYSNADIVLNDHWPDMARLGYISNRIFDVALAGGFLISDEFQGSDIFQGNVVTYRTAKELRDLYYYWLNHPEERAEKSKALQKYVLEHHTFDKRAEDIAKCIYKLGI